MDYYKQYFKNNSLKKTKSSLSWLLKHIKETILFWEKSKSLHMQTHILGIVHKKKKCNILPEKKESLL